MTINQLTLSTQTLSITFGSPIGMYAIAYASDAIGPSPGEISNVGKILSVCVKVNAL